MPFSCACTHGHGYATLTAVANWYSPLCIATRQLHVQAQAAAKPTATPPAPPAKAQPAVEDDEEDNDDLPPLVYSDAEDSSASGGKKKAGSSTAAKPAAKAQGQHQSTKQLLARPLEAPASQLTLRQRTRLVARLARAKQKLQNQKVFQMRMMSLHHLSPLPRMKIARLIMFTCLPLRIWSAS